MICEEGIPGTPGGGGGNPPGGGGGGGAPAGHVDQDKIAVIRND